MKYVEIYNAVVVGICDFETMSVNQQVLVEEDVEVEIGDMYINGVFVKPTQSVGERIEMLSLELSKNLDLKAQEFKYDSMLSARSYCGFENIFKAECLSLALWANACWIKFSEIETVMLADTTVMMSSAEMLAEMPIFQAS